jgi:ATP-binding cassette subfamily F protein 3
LSGGERARVALAILLLDKPNVLVLDEPTNHLDIASREALEGTLRQFPGTIFFVSHDRFFLDQVAQRLLILDPPGIKDFEGNYSGWQRKLAERERAAAEQAAEQAAERQKRGSKPAPRPTEKKVEKKPAKDNPYLRPFGRLTTKEVEQQITETEIALADCQERFGDAGKLKTPGEGKKLQAELEGLAEKLRQLEEEYYLREE